MRWPWQDKPHRHEWQTQGWDRHTEAAINRGNHRENAPAQAEQTCSCGETRWIDVRVTF